MGRGEATWETPHPFTTIPDLDPDLDLDLDLNAGSLASVTLRLALGLVAGVGPSGTFLGGPQKRHRVGPDDEREDLSYLIRPMRELETR